MKATSFVRNEVDLGYIDNPTLHKGHYHPQTTLLESNVVVCIRESTFIK